MNKQIKMTITQFDKYTDEELNTYTDTLNNILDMIENYEEYYYRITIFGKNTNSKRVKDFHFGVMTSNIGGLRLSEADYLNSYLNYIIAGYKKSFYLPSFWDVINHDNWYLEKMKQLSNNSEKGFQEAVSKFLNENPGFKEITDLNIVNEISGLYILILDEYKVCYIGQTQNIKKRIMSHWSKKDYFSGTGIDMFKAKDTTRIYVFPMNEKDYNMIDMFEFLSTKSIPDQYKLNVLSGGKLDFLLDNRLPLISRDGNDKEVKRRPHGLEEILLQLDKAVSQNMDRFIIE